MCILKLLLIDFKISETSDPIIFSPLAADHKSKEMWRTPVRSIRGAGKSHGEIRKATGLKRNLIEKIWRWMKNEINKLETIPTTEEDMIEALKELWDEVNSKEW